MTHRDVVVELARHHSWKLGCELGLARGLLLRKLLAACPKLHMIGVDMCRHPHRAADLAIIEEEYEDRVTILRGTTNEMADQVSDGLDFLFIDAGHGYEAVRDDIANWKGKVRKHGWVMGHDYDPVRNPGVVKAVDEAFGADVATLPFSIWVWDRGIGRGYLETVRKAFA